MTSLWIKGKLFQSVDGGMYHANCEGDMIWVHEDAIRMKKALQKQGKHVRCVKHSMGGDPFWVVYEEKEI